MSDDIRVQGLAELHKALQTLPARIEANIMRGALRAGANVVKATVRNMTPVGPPSATNAKRYGGRRGLLRDSTRVSVRYSRGTVTATVGTGGKVKGGGDAYYARFVHNGTRRHLIKARKPGGKLKLFGSRFVPSVMHPGSRANPWVDRAFRASDRAAIVAVGNYVAQRLRAQHGLDLPGPGNYDD